MFNLKNTEYSLKDLIAEIKSYILLQKRCMALDIAEKLIVLLSAIVVGALCLILGAIVLFFCSLALAFWIGNMCGNILWGFLCVGAITALLAIIVYCNRNRWITQPLARMIVKLFITPDDEYDEKR